MSSKIFNQNKNSRIQKSAFDLSHEKKLSGKMGQLMPVLLQEVVPGDKFNIDTESMIRFAPLVAPLYHRINSYIHYFYVPNRIIWKDWEKFITGASVSLPTFQLKAKGLAASPNSVADQLGIPTVGYTIDSPEIEINNLPFRAFLKIYQDYYRDQNLEPLLQDDFEEEFSEFELSKFFTPNSFIRAWEKDYFTSALPWAQKGNPVNFQGSPQYKPKSEFHPLDNASVTENTNIVTGESTPGGQANYLKNGGTGMEGFIDNIASINIPIEELRNANKLQMFLEKTARSGNRYVEHLLAHWGVRSSDARLQRAEYIGGGKTPIVISEVLNMTGTAELPQGNMSGHGISVGRTNHASKYIEEHGYIIGIMSILPEPNYQDGLHKLWSRKLQLDFPFPEFAQLGEQPVLNQELFLDTMSTANNEGTFGYQSRYAEMKYQPSTVHGHFRTTLDFWHAGRKFDSLPALNNEFIKCDMTDINERIFAVTDELAENLYIQLYHKITAVRPFPFYNTPSL
jgi:hypothetical protein